MAETKFREITGPEFVKLGETEIDGETVNQITGQLVEKNLITIRGNNVGKYSFSREDGSTFTILGAQLLDEKMQSVEVGDTVRITLNSEKMRTASGNEMKSYTVEVAE